jgi:hypothetical protein
MTSETMDLKFTGDGLEDSTPRPYSGFALRGRGLQSKQRVCMKEEGGGGGGKMGPLTLYMDILCTLKFSCDRIIGIRSKPDVSTG